MRLEWFNVPWEAKASWECDWPDRFRWEIETLSLYARVTDVKRIAGRVQIFVAWPVAVGEEMVAIEYIPGFQTIDDTIMT